MRSFKYRDMKFYFGEEVQRISEELEKAVAIPELIEIESEHKANIR